MKCDRFRLHWSSIRLFDNYTSKSRADTRKVWIEDMVNFSGWIDPLNHLLNPVLGEPAYLTLLLEAL